MVADKKSVVIFMSDHGEEVYDYRDKAVRPPIDENRKAEYAHSLHDIPIVIWFSHRYQCAYPEIVENAKASIHRKAISDKIGNTIMHLGFLNTKYYESCRDICSSFYNGGRRIYFHELDNSSKKYHMGISLNYDSIIAGRDGCYTRF